MGKQYLIELIRKYLRGQATDEDKRQLDAWWDYNLNDDAYLRSRSDTNQQQLFDGMLHDIWRRIDTPIPDDTDRMAPAHWRPDRTRPLPAPQRRIGPVLRWVALVGVLLLVAGMTYQYLNRFMVETAYGERREIRLPDGSLVMLNGNSSVHYGHWSDAAPREVWLQGEAFFTVTHTRNHQRFVVHTPDNLTVEALGTRFNVNSRHTDTQVILQEGRVRVINARQQSITMRPGHQLCYAVAHPALVLTPTDMPRQLSWREKQLLFDNQPLSAVFARLRDSHGLRVSIRPQGLAEQPFSGSVPADEIEQVFGKIEKIYGVHVRRENDQFIIE